MENSIFYSLLIKKYILYYILILKILISAKGNQFDPPCTQLKRTQIVSEKKKKEITSSALQKRQNTSMFDLGTNY